MAKLSSGEITIQTKNRRITLRLEMGVSQELEDYFNLPILDLLLQKFNEKTPFSDDLLMVYAAMTGRDIKEGDQLIEACKEMMDEVGVPAALMGVKQCLWSTHAPKSWRDIDHNIDQNFGQNIGELPGKPQAVQSKTQPLNRRPMSWARYLMQRGQN